MGLVVRPEFLAREDHDLAIREITGTVLP